VIVLDTHVWHWWVNQIEGKLSASTIALIERGERVAVSAISVYEMAWLVKHGRIELPMAFSDHGRYLGACRAVARSSQRLARSIDYRYRDCAQRYFAYARRCVRAIRSVNRIARDRVTQT
jgi:hypothetical protein